MQLGTKKTTNQAIVQADIFEMPLQPFFTDFVKIGNSHRAWNFCKFFSLTNNHRPGTFLQFTYSFQFMTNNLKGYVHFPLFNTCLKKKKIAYPICSPWSSQLIRRTIITREDILLHLSTLFAFLKRN